MSAPKTFSLGCFFVPAKRASPSSLQLDLAQRELDALGILAQASELVVQRKLALLSLAW